MLAAVGKTTLVSVQANVMVAGEPSYQLVLAPKDSRSLVGKVVIAVDGKYGVPLRVQLFAKGAARPPSRSATPPCSGSPPTRPTSASPRRRARRSTW